MQIYILLKLKTTYPMYINSSSSAPVLLCTEYSSSSAYTALGWCILIYGLVYTAEYEYGGERWGRWVGEGGWERRV
jgi:hypothetical protein